MQKELQEQLRKITDEEKRILNGEAEVDKDLYTSGNDFTVDSSKMLEEGKQEVIIMSVLKILQEILLMEQKY